MQDCETGVGRLSLRAALLILLATALAGCAHKESATVGQSLLFSPRAAANGGRPLYVVIRVVNENQFLTDSYQSISSLVYPSSTDAGVLAVVLVWPEREQRIQIEVPKGKSVGIYAIFTKPGDPWKLLLSEPGQHEIRAILEAGTLSLEQVKAKGKGK